MTDFDLPAARWRKSSRSQAQQCVELAFGEAVRDSKNPDRVLALGGSAYRSFLADVRLDRFRTR
ncbi:DUF397 domain-containing protein [Actinokineospora auranticolor]|uniref:Uncharacterized protein DUF397 n=1 Tax=Actinokineospora auranticolor TaxID=155976 RepID=A0A2S6GH05_9PSEU|nr:DUF397 domain-containing protein [Actinokineospora auranticolor]PPK64485.1 uncharacterized protein DUF397 [Actinokineospora auranticolor]